MSEIINTTQCFKVIGINKMYQVKVFGTYSLQESAEIKKAELEKTNEDFKKKYEKFMFDNQMPTARELKVSTKPEYERAIKNLANEFQEKQNKFMEENMPEFIDFEFIII